MGPHDDDTARRGLRGWWRSPPRAGMQRLINPWEYRHLRLVGTMRIVGGTVGVGAGAVCLSYRLYRWAAFFLVVAVLNVAGGCWYVKVARRPSRPGTSRAAFRVRGAGAGEATARRG